MAQGGVAVATGVFSFYGTLRAGAPEAACRGGAVVRRRQYRWWWSYCPGQAGLVSSMGKRIGGGGRRSRDF